MLSKSYWKKCRGTKDNSGFYWFGLIFNISVTYINYEIIFMLISQSGQYFIESGGLFCSYNTVYVTVRKQTTHATSLQPKGMQTIMGAVGLAGKGVRPSYCD